MHDVPYLGVDVGEGTGGDISESLAEVQSPMRLPYVRVEDLARTLDAVRSNGGEVRKYRTEDPGMGTYAIIVDPTGGVLGLWQPPSVWPTEFLTPKVTDMLPDPNGRAGGTAARARACHPDRGADKGNDVASAARIAILTFATKIIVRRPTRKTSD